MSKPNDISQEAWDAALELVNGLYLNEDEDGRAYVPSDEYPAIARAIMSAEKRGEERERAACAKVCDVAADQCLDERNKHRAKSELRISNHAAMTLAVDLSAAIRKRGA